MKYKDFGSWKSGGLFVLRLKDTPGMPPVDFLIVGDKSRDGIRDQHDDWKGVIDRIAGSYQMKDSYSIRSSSRRRAPTVHVTFPRRSAARPSTGFHPETTPSSSSILLRRRRRPPRSFADALGSEHGSRLPLNRRERVDPGVSGPGGWEGRDARAHREATALRGVHAVRIQQQIAIASGAASLARSSCICGSSRAGSIFGFSSRCSLRGRSSTPCLKISAVRASRSAGARNCWAPR